jgi:hypothetical protein
MEEHRKMSDDWKHAYDGRGWCEYEYPNGKQCGGDKDDPVHNDFIDGLPADVMPVPSHVWPTYGGIRRTGWSQSGTSFEVNDEEKTKE